MPKSDPLDTLAVGLSADHKAEKRKTALKGKTTTEPAAEAAAPETIEQPEPTPADEQARVEAERPTPDARVNLDTPPAPGDDPESVFDRRLARLDAIAQGAQFEAGTAFGDARDCLLDLFKHQPKLWAAMTPSERNSAVKLIETAARQIVHKVVLIVAQEESDTIQGTLDKKWTVNGETLEAKVKFDNADNETLMDLFGLAGHRVVIVSADDKRFMSARGSQDQGTDQLEIPLDPFPTKSEAPATPPPAPEGDTDLNPDDDSGDPIGDIIAAGKVGVTSPDVTQGVFGVPPVAQAATTEGENWGVYDTSRNEWLQPDSAGDDEWSADGALARQMTHGEATDLAVEFREEGEEERFVVRAVVFAVDAEPAADPDQD